MRREREEENKDTIRKGKERRYAICSKQVRRIEVRLINWINELDETRQGKMK